MNIKRLCRVLPLPHQSEVACRQPWRGEIVARDCLPPEPRGPLPTCGSASATGSAAAAGYVGSLLHVAGSTAAAPQQPPPCRSLAAVVPRLRAAGNNSQATIPSSCMSRFSLANHGQDNPTPLLVLLWKYQRRQRTQCISLFIKYTFLFSKTSKIPTARFTPNVISSYVGTIGRLGELKLVLKNLIKWDFHAMGPLRWDSDSTDFIQAEVFTSVPTHFHNLFNYPLQTSWCLSPRRRKCLHIKIVRPEGSYHPH